MTETANRYYLENLLHKKDCPQQKHLDYIVKKKLVLGK